MNELTVRSDIRGVVISDEVIVRGPIVARRARRQIILIHGFQNSQDRARQVYAEFLGALRAALGIHEEESLGSFWAFHWPGNHPVEAVSMLTYSVRVPVAELAGLRLGEHLERMDRRQEVVLVAHSLGCRVAMEALKYIRKKGGSYRGANLRAVCLLAAAVSSTLCRGDRAPFASRLEGCTEHILHSMKDRVLLLAFPIGQRIYGEKGVAVGLRGSPWGRWPRSMSTGLGHGGYWSSFHVAEYVGCVLGKPSWRHLSESTLAEQASEIEEHWLPEHHLKNFRP
jgi:pimeloyl-ACP methyl ester carboxylesterase